MTKKILILCAILEATYFSTHLFAGTYSFSQTVFNNAPWFVSLNDTGALTSAYYQSPFYPPNDVRFKDSFIINSTKSISLTNMTYLISNPSPQGANSPFSQGCEIVSLSVDEYHRVTEVVRPVNQGGGHLVIECLCYATEGISPDAVLIINYKPEGASSASATCFSSPNS